MGPDTSELLFHLSRAVENDWPSRGEDGWFPAIVGRPYDLSPGMNLIERGSSSMSLGDSLPASEIVTLMKLGCFRNFFSRRGGFPSRSRLFCSEVPSTFSAFDPGLHFGKSSASSLYMRCGDGPGCLSELDFRRGRGKENLKVRGMTDDVLPAARSRCNS